MHQHPSAAARDHAWAIWDVDGDGELSFDELSRAVPLSFPDLNDPEIIRLSFKAADNGDGRVSRREFRLVLEYIAYFNRLQRQFAQLDSDGNGTLSESEFVSSAAIIGMRNRGGRALSHQELRAYFKVIDTDGSGTIEFDEFAVWAVRNQVGQPPSTRTTDHSETPERERELREQTTLMAEMQTQIYSPWKARAIARWPPNDSDAELHPSDLQFDAGDIVSVTSKHCNKWWTGAVHGRHGTFPCRLVKLLPPGSRDAEVQAIEREEARTRVCAHPAGAAEIAVRTKAETSRLFAYDSGKRWHHRVGGARTPHAQPPLTLPASEELAHIFQRWDPNGSGGNTATSAARSCTSRHSDVLRANLTLNMQCCCMQSLGRASFAC